MHFISLWCEQTVIQNAFYLPEFLNSGKLRRSHLLSLSCVERYCRWEKKKSHNNIPDRNAILSLKMSWMANDPCNSPRCSPIERKTRTLFDNTASICKLQPRWPLESVYNVSNEKGIHKAIRRMSVRDEKFRAKTTSEQHERHIAVRRSTWPPLGFTHRSNQGIIFLRMCLKLLHSSMVAMFGVELNWINYAWRHE